MKLLGIEKKGLIISGFPGVGKSYAFKNTELDISDSDSSNFSWIEPGKRHPDFPMNYMKHIKQIKDKHDYIFVSSHKAVRDALVEAKLYFILVYPDRKLKEEYLARYEKRSNHIDFINKISNNWNNFIDDMENQTNCKKIVLRKNQYLDLEKIDVTL